MQKTEIPYYEADGTRLEDRSLKTVLYLLKADRLSVVRNRKGEIVSAHRRDRVGGNHIATGMRKALVGSFLQPIGERFRVWAIPGVTGSERG